jgi:hypothetical protein
MSSSFEDSSVVNKIISSLSTQNNEIQNMKSLLSSYNESSKLETENIRNNLKSEMEGLKTSLQSINLGLINKIYEMKESYIKELKDYTKSSEDSSTLSLLNVLDKQNNILVDK